MSDQFYGSSAIQNISLLHFQMDLATSSNSGPAIEGNSYQGKMELKSEEEQLRLLREQQEEIDTLKAKLNITDLPATSDQTSLTDTMTTTTNTSSTSVKAENSGISIPDPLSFAKTLQDIADDAGNQNEQEESQAELLKSPTDMVTSPATVESTGATVTTDDLQSSDKHGSKNTTGSEPLVEDTQDIYDASATAEIMREALQRTEQSEQDEANQRGSSEREGRRGREDNANSTNHSTSVYCHYYSCYSLVLT